MLKQTRGLNNTTNGDASPEEDWTQAEQDLKNEQTGTA